MMWQMWTAFGIMFGYVSSLAFYHVKDTSNVTGLNWRLMLGSAGFPAIFVMAQVFLLPESPRWLLGKGRYVEAFQSLCRVRNSKLQAARDLYYIHVLVEEEAAIARGRNLALELFTVPRVRRATLASGIVMFMQQFCGVNVIVSVFSFIHVSRASEADRRPNRHIIVRPFSVKAVSQSSPPSLVPGDLACSTLSPPFQQSIPSTPSVDGNSYLLHSPAWPFASSSPVSDSKSAPLINPHVLVSFPLGSTSSHASIHQVKVPFHSLTPRKRSRFIFVIMV